MTRLIGAGGGVALGLAGRSVGGGVHGQTTEADTLHRAIFRELIEINTSPLGGDVSRASRAVQRRLLAAGFATRDVQVIGPGPGCMNVVATLRGRVSAEKPVLLMAHLDVVNAKRADWKYDPYVLREEQGWFYARGAVDNKAGASVLVANMVRWKRERFVPARDVIMILTCDEETTDRRSPERRSDSGVLKWAGETNGGRGR